MIVPRRSYRGPHRFSRRRRETHQIPAVTALTTSFFPCCPSLHTPGLLLTLAIVPIRSAHYRAVGAEKTRVLQKQDVLITREHEERQHHAAAGYAEGSGLLYSCHVVTWTILSCCLTLTVFTARWRTSLRSARGDHGHSPPSEGRSHAVHPHTVP